MKEINESLKSKNLTQKDYHIKSFAVLKEMFRKDRKYLPSIIALFALSGYTMYNSFTTMVRVSIDKQPFPKLPLSETLMNLLILVVIEYALNLFQNDVITRIDNKNELARKDVLLRSVLLAVVMVFLSDFMRSLGPLGVLVIFALAYFAAFFRQIYLSRNVNLTAAFEKNVRLLEGNRVRIILPLFLTNIISNMVYSASFSTIVTIISLKLANSAMIITIILIISRILVGLFEIYKKILASVIFLNVENNK